MTRIAERVRAAQLRNGARVYLLESQSNLTVDLVGYLDGGLLLERPERSGVANLCVATLDRGSERRTHDEIAETLESCGAQLGFGLTPEMVTFRFRCLIEDLEQVLEVMADSLRSPTFPEAQLQIARDEARAGLREAAFDTYTRAYEQAAARVAGPAHAYARDPLGEEKLLSGLTRAEVESFHRRMLDSSNLHLAMVGPLGSQEAFDLLEATCGTARVGGDAAPAEGSPSPESPGYPAPAAHPWEHIEVADKDQVDLILMRAGVPRTDERFEIFALANFLAGGTFVSRLNTRLRDQEGLTYGAQSTIVSGLEPGLWYASASVHPRDVERAIELIRDELRSLAADGPQEEELQEALQHLTGSFPIRLEANRVVASVLLDGVRSGRGLDYIDHYRERIGQIDARQVAEACRTLWADGQWAIVSAGSRLNP